MVSVVPVVARVEFRFEKQIQRLTGGSSFQETGSASQHDRELRPVMLTDERDVRRLCESFDTCCRATQVSRHTVCRSSRDPVKRNWHHLCPSFHARIFVPKSKFNISMVDPAGSWRRGQATRDRDGGGRRTRTGNRRTADAEPDRRTRNPHWDADAGNTAELRALAGHAAPGRRRTGGACVVAQLMAGISKGVGYV